MQKNFLNGNKMFRTRNFERGFRRRFTMNYFGMFFSFMLPGIVLGGMGAVAVHQELQRRKRQKARKVRRARRPELRQVADKGKLYVYDMNAAA